MGQGDKRIIAIVLAAALIDTIGFGIVIPVLPSLIERLGHVGLGEATRIGGYLAIVFAVTQFFAGPVLGNLSDRYGRRPVLIGSMFAFGLDYLAMAAAPSLVWLFVGRAIAGVAGAIYAPASSVLADVTPPEQRARVFGWIGGAFGIGFIIGPAIGGLLAGLGPRAPFIAAAMLAIANSAVMTFLLPESLARENRRPFRWQDANILSALKPIFHSGEAAPLLLAWFLWQIAHNVYPATWSFWARARFDWSDTAIGWSLAFVGLIMAFVQGGATGPVIDRIGERRAVVAGLGAGALAFFGYTIITASWQAYAVFLVGSVSGLVYPAMNGLLSRLVDARHQGALQGGLGSMATLATIIATLALTQALAMGIEHRMPGAAFLIASVLAGAALAIVATRVLGQVGARENPA